MRTNPNEKDFEVGQLVTALSSFPMTPEYEQTPLVSIITVVYNAEDTLQRTIDSVAVQSYPNIEYVIVDGGSKDRTIDILIQNQSIIDKWVSESDSGIYDAMNKGIQMSSGPIVGIINSDDWYERDTIASIVRVFTSDSRVDIVHGAMRVWYQTGSIHAEYRQMTGYPDYCVAPFHHPTCFVRRSVYDDLGVFDLRFPTAADYDLMLRMRSSKKRDVYLDTVLANFTLGGNTTRSTWSPYVQIAEVLQKNRFHSTKIAKGVLFRLFRDAGANVVRRTGGIALIRKRTGYHVTEQG